MDGKLIIFSAPSGSGKTTLARSVMKVVPNLGFSISACTRDPRPGEVHGKDYYFLSPTEFKDNIESDAFAEWEEVYANNYYGTLKSEVERLWQKNMHVVFDVDVKGGLKLKEAYGDKALAIFVKSPTLGDLEKRLKSRNTETEESLKRRLDKAEYEWTFMDQFDKVVINDQLDKAVAETTDLIKAFLA